MANSVRKKHKQPIRRNAWVGCCHFLRGALPCAVMVLVLFPTNVLAGNISLTLSGGITFIDANPTFVPVLGPEPITVEVKAVGRRGIPWSLTLMADNDFSSGIDTIPITSVSWAVFPSPPYADGTLSTVVPTLIAGGLTHEHDVITFNFSMQNSWVYNAGNYTATATFTLAAP